MCDEKNCGHYRKDGCLTGCVQAADVSNSRLIGGLNAISDVLGGMIVEAKKKHDSGDWPHKFLYAHEGIGLIKAVEVIEKYRKEYGI